MVSQSNQEDNRIPDSRQDQTNRNASENLNHGELNASVIPDFQFTPLPPRRNDDNKGSDE